MPQPILILLDYIQKIILDLDSGIKKRSLRKTKVAYEKLTELSNYLKEELPEDFIEENFKDFDRHMHFIDVFLRKKDFEWISSNFDDIKERDLPKIRTEIVELIEKQKAPEKRKIPVRPRAPKKEISTLSNKVFIVHGRDHEPMKELKTIVYEFGLYPIVLHEKASGGLTLAEKLERYSKDVGFAFVILTPDDIGCHKTEIKGVVSDLNASFLQRTVAVSRGYIENIMKKFKSRARQNVIFEMGYFWGLLKRQKVCCLLKGDVEKPSDIEGILYIPFKDSVEEVRLEIFKELTEAGYEIKL